jgi:RND family efflux transporter MFP subunit
MNNLTNQTGMKVLVAAIIVVIAGGMVAEQRLAASPAPANSMQVDRRPRVELVHPRRLSVAQRLRTNATLEAFEEADLLAKVSGYLSDVRVDIGDHVRAGQVLAVIDVPETESELAEAEAHLEVTRKALETAQRQVEHNKAELALQVATRSRQATLNRDGWVSDQAFDEIRAKDDIARADLGLAEASRDQAAAQVDEATATIEKTKALLAYSKITAPFDGVVAQRLVNRGDLVQAATATRATALFKVQRIDTIRVFFDVPENEVPHVRVGDRASVKPYGLDNEPIVSTVTRFAHRLDSQTRNMRTEIDLPNPDERLYPGTYAEVALEMDRRLDALTLPASAIDSDGGGSFVYTVNDNRITRVAIKIGPADNGNIEVIAGLSDETPVVATIKAAPPPGTAVAPRINGGKS